MPIDICGMAPLLEVFDMPTSIAFYRDKLGFKITGDSGQGDKSGWVMLELGGFCKILIRNMCARFTLCEILQSWYRRGSQLSGTE